MKNKLFGRHTGLAASELVLGTGVLGNRNGYGASKEDAKAIFQLFTASGGNFIDTSDAYQSGEAEELIGAFTAGRRTDFIICSKYTRTSQANPSIAGKGNHRKAMIQAVEASLKRLQTDYVDIYMPHYDDGKTPFEEVLRGLEDLVQSGKIIYPGLSNFPAWKAATMAGMAKAFNATPLTAVQFEYSLLQRTPDREFWPVINYFGLGAMVYSPLAGGQLTGKYRKGETGRMNLKGDNGLQENDISKAIIDYLQEIATEMNAAAGHVALAWVLAKGSFAIIGPRTAAQMEDNLKAAELRLEDRHIIKLDELSAILLGYPHELLASVQQAYS